jgi:hypothetical protein
VLKEELGLIYVGLPNFHNIYFGRVPELETASEEFYKLYYESYGLLFHNGRTGRLKDVKQEDVVSCFIEINKLATFTEGKTTLRI